LIPIRELPKRIQRPSEPLFDLHGTATGVSVFVGLVLGLLSWIFADTTTFKIAEPVRIAAVLAAFVLPPLAGICLVVAKRALAARGMAQQYTTLYNLAERNSSDNLRLQAELEVSQTQLTDRVSPCGGLLQAKSQVDS
jgi:hypothetical protein